MRIVRLVKRNNYVNIEFENGEKQKVHYEVAVKSGLRKNDILDDIKLKKILEADEDFTLKDSALRFLSMRPHSSFELYTKLLKKGFPKQKISSIINDLKQRDYLSDENFAEKFIEEALKKKKGKNKIKAELMKKGIDGDIIEKKLAASNDDEKMQENALELAEKKLNFLLKKDLTEMQLKQKLYSFLQNRGYTFDIIKIVTDEVMNKIKE